MSTVIKVENLSKQYRLGLVGTGTFKEDTRRFWARIRGKEDPYATLGEENDRTKIGQSNYVWSLRDINFEVNQGDVLGIIGKNGAGKSTLLKILSKVTTPTTGSVKAKGRIASLLEVGTGFHPELTGRENIYLNGAILGMRKHEITRKLDEIIAFAGVERYLDTPVKRYSSGMYVRLAFAVAAHLENEILILDEVLAVGDADFQKKCLGKIGEVSKGGGRTVIFVSHNTGSILQLCKRSILLENGKIIKQGAVDSVMDFYLSKKFNGVNAFLEKDLTKEIFVSEAWLEDNAANKKTSFLHTDEILIKLKIIKNKWVPNSEFRFVLRDTRGKAIFTSDYVLDLNRFSNNENCNITLKIPSFFLRPGEFTITFAIFVPHQSVVHLAEEVILFNIFDGGSKYSASEGLDYGYVFYNPDISYY